MRDINKSIKRIYSHIHWTKTSTDKVLKFKIINQAITQSTDAWKELLILVLDVYNFCTQVS